MNGLRRHLDLLLDTVRQSKERRTAAENSIRGELREVFEPLLNSMHESVVFLQDHEDGR